MTEMMHRASAAPGPAGGAGSTREAWLHAAIEAFRPRFAEAGMPLPAKVHVSVGFSYGAKAESKTVLGECWARRASADGVNQIFISPLASDPAAMLATLLHELIHAADDCAHGHKGPFAAAAARLGLEGKMTATVAGLALAAELIVLAAELGEFPHAALNPAAAARPVPGPPGSPAPAPLPPVKSGPGKQGTRMIKLTAAACCGYTVRTTRKWLDEGLPQCPHGAAMTEE
jgi:SprT-like family